EALLRTQSKLCLSPLPSRLGLTTQLVQERREEQSLCSGKSVAEPLCVREGCFAPLLRLVRIPQQPQTHGTKEAAGDARVLAVANGMGVQLLGVIQSQALLHVSMSEAHLSQEK